MLISLAYCTDRSITLVETFDYTLSTLYDDIEVKEAHSKS
jgi:hypothetical protein